MMFYRKLLFIITNVSAWTNVFFSTVTPLAINEKMSSPLNNQHLAIAAIESPLDFIVIRNSTGHIIRFDGISWNVFEWLSAAHINTTLHITPMNPLITPLDSFNDKTGILDLVGKGEYDMVTGSAPTLSRVAIVDYSHPTIYVSISYLIPSPDQSINILSATKPFDTWVWITLFATILLVVGSIIFLASSLPLDVKVKKQSFKLEIAFYVIGVLLHQAFAYKFGKKLAIRIVVITWGISALLLINYYNSLCVSFMTVSLKKPLIQSIQELRNRPEIQLVMDKNRNVQATLLSAESGFLKDFGDRIRANPGTLCSHSSQCVDLVKEGKAVYTGAKGVFLLKLLKEDFEATGKCNMEMGKENYLELQFAWASQKKSPYLDPINKSFMRMAEAGLLQKWYEERLPKVEKCYSGNKMNGRKTTMEGREPLPLKGFTGVFLIFIIGMSISLIVFFVEAVISKRSTRTKHRNGIIVI